MTAQVEFVNLSQKQTPGSVGLRLLQAGFNINNLRTNDILRKDEWIDLDTNVVEVARERLVAVGDLTSRGLTYSLPNALGKTKHEWQQMSDLTDAQITMSGLSDTGADLLEFGTQSLPLPIIHKDFHIDARRLAASRNNGEPLDVLQARMAAKVVAEKIESLVFNGSAIAGTTNQIYGYFNAPQRNTGSTTADWNTATGAQILDDLLRMIAAAATDLMFGPYMVYTSRAAYTHLGDDYKAESDKTILARLKEVPEVIDIRPSHHVPSNRVVLVQMTSDVVDIIDGIQPTIVEWSSHGGMMLNFKVLAIMIPRIRNDFENRSGIVDFT